MEIDYKKAYKEALERAKRLRDSFYQTMNAKRVVEEIFPELAESEDERIIEGFHTLIRGIRRTGGLTLNKVPLDKCEAWLEKQKDSLHIPETCKENADSFTDELEKEFEKYLSENIEFDRAGSALDKWNEGCHLNRNNLEDIARHFADWQKEQKPLITGNDFGWIDELKHDLKHPEELDQKVDDVLKQRKGIRTVEWSEEDEKIRKEIIECIETLIKAPGANPRLCDWLAWLEKQKEHKPAEWSEEDQNNVNVLLSIIGEVREMNIQNTLVGYVETVERKRRFDKLEAWLKSLRPQPHWKPSEEQMRVLKQVEDRVAMKDGYWEQVLDSLYLDLQKL